MKTKSLFNRKVQLAFGTAILALLVVGALFYRGMAFVGAVTSLLIAAAVSWRAHREACRYELADEAQRDCEEKYRMLLRGRPEEILRITAASGRHEEHGMRVRKDGLRFLASVTFTALRDRAGNLRGFSEFSHDLSESKESEAKYRGLLEAAPDAMVVVNQGGENCSPESSGRETVWILPG